MATSRSSSLASSQLSSHGSSEFGEDVKVEDADSTLGIAPSESRPMPANKRRRLGPSSYRSTPLPQQESHPEDYGDISSDTDGSIPPSPNNDQFTMMQDEDPRHHMQVRVCKWDGCDAGDVENMDNLVKHMHKAHIGDKETNYSCEWMDCNRKGTPHASAYALKAHMRSHTKEKPFYCALPECDRSFTRSDALAKHMRTVHETEALRPSDPVPRNYNSAHFKPQRLKLTVKPPAAEKGDGDGDSNATLSGPENGDEMVEYEYPTDVTFDEKELAMPPSQLFRLLRRQVTWSEQKGEELMEEVQNLEKKKREEWMAKELVLANLMEAELAIAHKCGESEAKVLRIVEEDLPGEPLPLNGLIQPWYRQIDDEELSQMEPRG